jgi:hypothetical protein
MVAVKHGIIDSLNNKIIKMKNVKYILGLFLSLAFLVSCEDEDYDFGDIIAPSNLQITVDIVGSETNPTGDGSGTVHFTATADDAITYKFVYNSIGTVSPDGNQTYNFGVTGEHRYTVTVIASGTGGVSTSATIEVDVLVLFEVPDLIYGTWKLAPEAGALAVGPAPDNLSWWSNSAADVVTRACFFDDEYIFNEDGSFQNVLQSETWLEPWQGVDNEMCGAPVAPHDGTSEAVWMISANEITINGLGAYLGIPKVHNAGEDGNPANNTIVYTYILSEEDNTLEVSIVGYAGGGGTETWSFKFVKQ